MANNTLDGITLPTDLIWTNEFDDTTIAQDIKRSLTGAQIISESVKIKGRKITLTGGEDYAWLSRNEVQALKTLSNTVDNTIVLVFNGQTINVRFDQSKQGLVAKPVIACSDPDQHTKYYIVVNLIEV